MAREGHAFERQPDAPADLQVQNRQRDGNAGASVQHLVEEAVARIVVLLFVAAETEFAEEIVVEPADDGKRIVVLRQAAAGLAGEMPDLFKLRG